MADLTLVKQQLKAILKRDVGVEQLKSGKYICKYMNHSVSPLQLVADTEDDAYRNLLRVLQSFNEPDSPGPEVA